MPTATASLRESPEGEGQDVQPPGLRHLYPTLERIFSESEVLCVKNARIGTDSPPVSVPVVTSVENARIAADPSDDVRAAAMVATPMASNVSKWKQPESKRENLGQIPISDRRASVVDGIDPDAPHTLLIDVGAPEEPDWLQDRPDDQGPPSGQCIHCPEPLAPGHKAYCSYHKALIDAEPFRPVDDGGG